MLEQLALISGAAMALAIFPQTYKIWKDKAARDVSVLTFVILTIGSFIWLLYGIDIADLPVTISYGLRFVAAALTLVLIIKFSRKK